MGLRLERASCGLMLLVAVLAGPSLAFAVGEMHLAYFKVTWSTTPGVWQITPHRFELDQWVHQHAGEVVVVNTTSVWKPGSIQHPARSSVQRG